jgi:hypothetical protein
MNLDLYFTPSTKINSKMSHSLNVRAETVKFLKENKEVSLHDFLLGNGFLYVTTKA